MISSLLPGNYELADGLEGRLVTLLDGTRDHAALAAALDTPEPSGADSGLAHGGRGPAPRMIGATCRP